MHAIGGCARDQSTTQYCGEAVAAHARIADLEAELAEQNNKAARLAVALDKIRNRDWSWQGGGSDVRVPGEMSRIASDALGIPHDLPSYPFGELKTTS
jgi:hypothetical protein